MRTGSVITCIFCAGTVVGLAIWLAVEHQARLRLLGEHNALEQQLGQMAGLIAENERLSHLVAQVPPPQSPPDDQSRELLRLRGEAGVLRQQARELEAVRSENRQARAALESRLTSQATGAAKATATADYWPRDSWAFTGYATPDAALQTSFWAASNGDVKALMASATGDVRQMMEKDLAGRPDAEASIKAMDEVSDIKSVRVLSREPQGDDTVVLTAEIQDQRALQTGKLIMKKVGDEWKLSGLSQ